MDSVLVEVVLQQLLGQSPILLAYLAGSVLALAFWRRHPLASLLTLIATVTSFLVTVGQTFAVQYLIYERARANSDINTILAGVTVLGGFCRASGIGLLLAAVFVERTNTHERDVPGERRLDETLERSIWSFQGRISRSTFWARFFLILLANLIVGLLIEAILPSASNPSAVALILLIYVPTVVAGIWLSLAMQVKRWHDLDKSGWMVLLNFTIIALPILLVIMGAVRGTTGSNRFGAEPLRRSSRLNS